MRTFDTRQSGVETLIFHREALVIDAEVVQDGGVEVVDVDWIIDDVVRVIVRPAVVDAGLEASACYASHEAAAVMITTVIVLR